MKSTIEASKIIDKSAEYKTEYNRLLALFDKSDDTIEALATGLIQDAAYLYAENKVLRAMLQKIGMVRISQNNPARQRPVEAAKQYRANCDTYSSIMGRLYRMLGEQEPEDEDDMEEYENG